MKTLAEIESTRDLDSRVISAAALLEFELRPSGMGTDSDLTLGELVQQQPCFVANGFLRDINFALGIRNSIAHYTGQKAASDNEKTRAAEHLIRAIGLVRQATGKEGGDVAKASRGANTFDQAKAQAALNAIFIRRRFAAAAASLAIVMACAAIAMQARSTVPPQYILGGGVILAIVSFCSHDARRSLRRKQYYSLPGARCENGDHRCVFCGVRSPKGRGIYTHGKYRSNLKIHECSRCRTELFVSTLNTSSGHLSG